MAEKTGTLWEGMNVSGDHSCCHGFPSLAAWLIAREALGIRKVDCRTKTVELACPKTEVLAWCKGRIPLGDGMLSLGWHQRADKRTLKVTELPAGWRMVDVNPKEGVK